MADSVTIRSVGGDDREGWQRLWEAYLDFYETSLPSSRTDLLWSRIIDPDQAIEALLAECDGAIAGLVHYLPHPNTWEEHPVCYLQDLFVDRSARGRGIGEQLIRAVQHRARDQGWASVYWQTAEDNTAARGLYDKLTGGVSGFVVYDLDL